MVVCERVAAPLPGCVSCNGSQAPVARILGEQASGKSATLITRFGLTGGVLKTVGWRSSISK